jgi:integrase
MKVRKISRYDDGQRTKSEKFYAVFADHRGIIRRLPLFEHRKASDEAARKITHLVNLRAANDTIPEELTRFIETTTTFIRSKLAEYGIIAATKLTSNKTLREHVQDWKASLLAKGTTATHATLVSQRAQKPLDGCGYVHWSEVTASRIQTYLHSLREGTDKTKGVSAQTYNFYLQAIKQFARFMVRDGRVSHSPLEHLQGLNVKADRRHDRRAFTISEFRWFLASIQPSSVQSGIPGSERALIYRLAVETGFRRGELASLTKDSFDLNSDDPGVTVSAKAAKARRQRRAPLHSDTVSLVSEHVKQKMPGAKVFKIPSHQHSAKMVRHDLAVARAAWIKASPNDEERSQREQSNFLRYEDDAGRFLDFHALRHTRGVWLFEHYRLHPREVQELMGVSSLTLVDRYTQSFKLTDLSFVERAPDLSPPAGARQNPQKETA